MPLTFFEEGDAIVLVASYGGRPYNPAWFENLSRIRRSQVDDRRRDAAMTARRASPDERARLWPKVVATYAGYATYQAKTSREIPLAVVTER